ncbi:MAG: DUF6212 domain-containing protein [Paracoccus sp. (in: a-proteobacteria)]|uniref:DUF6212 domain-containing protein n=1 Tax=Paracoccus sp. TaxID=267 RepID=UPI0039E340FB
MPSVPEYLGKIPRVIFDSANEKQLYCDLIDILLNRAVNSEEDAGRARLSAAILRRENGDLEENLKSVENFLYTLGNPRFMRALSWEPVGSMVTLAPGAELAQRLPVGAASVAAVDLWVPAGLREDLARLTLHLVCASGQSHDLARSPALAGVDAGWMRFVLPAPLPGPEQDCVLRLTWTGAQPFALGLGHAVPDPSFAARLAGTPGEERVLAVRVWKSLPGVRLPEPGLLLPDRAPVLPGDAGFISPAELPLPELFAVPPLATDHVSTAFWESEDAIMVHPSRQGAVCAVIRDVELPALAHISALVNVGHPRAPSLNFSVGVAPHGQVDEDGYWQRRMGPWVHGLPAHGWSQAHCIPVETIMGRADILLAVSLASDMPNDMSWGLFRGFRISRRDNMPLTLQ